MPRKHKATRLHLRGLPPFNHLTVCGLPLNPNPEKHVGALVQRVENNANSFNEAKDACGNCKRMQQR